MITLLVSKWLRRAKWLLLAILKNQVPFKDIHKIIKPFNNWDKNLAEREISKVVFLSWKTNWLTKKHFLEIKKLVLKNPTWEFIYFDNKAEDLWMQNNFKDKLIYQIYKESKFGAMKSDIFRYCLLSEYGGIFLSINMLLDKKIDDLIANQESFLVSVTDLPYYSSFFEGDYVEKYFGKSFVQSCLISPKGHPITKIAIKLIEDRYLICKGQRYGEVDRAIWWFTGPYLLTDAIAFYLSKGGTDIVELGKDFDSNLIRSHQAKFRYLFEPSYIGYRNCKII